MKRKCVCLLLLAAMLTSCGGVPTETTADTTATDTTETTPVETEAVYPGEIGDYEGYTFTFLNCQDEHWGGAHHILDYEELTGESVSDAIYNRNRQVEDEMNITFTVEKDTLDQLYKHVQTSVNAGDDTYDAAYIPLLFGNTVTLTGDYTLNLHQVPGLNLSEDWWNQSYIESATIGIGEKKALHAITDYVCLMGYAYGNVLYFNKDMATNYGLDMPYDAVREGEWTYDLMFTTYTQPEVALNGETDFKPKLNGSAVYSFAIQHAEGSMSLLNGAGQYFVSKDEKGMPVLKTDNSIMVDAYDKMTGYLSQDGYCVKMNTAELSGKTIFDEGRAMFFQGSLGLSASAGMRDLEMEYGILPLPKFTASQDRYYTMVSQYTSALNIPVVASDPARTGAIMDYMAYLSYQDVIPTFMNALCYKGVRDDDSIEMLELLLQTQTADIGFLYGWTNDLLTDLCNKAVEGNNTFASALASKTEGIQKKIDTFLEQYSE